MIFETKKFVETENKQPLSLYFEKEVIDFIQSYFKIFSFNDKKDKFSCPIYLD